MGPQFNDLHKFFAEQCASADDVLQNLLADHETIIRQLRTHADAAASKYHDAGTTMFSPA